MHTHRGINHPRPSARSFLQLCGSERSSSSLASILVCNTPVLDVAWRSDRREIFSTPQNDGYRCSMESKGLQIRAQRPNIAQEASTRLQQVVCHSNNRAVRSAIFAMYFSVRAHSHIFCMGIFAK